MKSSKARTVIRHVGDPDDLILNTAWMHDAKHMQGLRVPVQPLDMNLAILEGAAREIRSRSDTTSGASMTSTAALSYPIYPRFSSGLRNPDPVRSDPQIRF
jgi:hypothetical protein